MVASYLAWQQRIGRQRDWIWRGWQTRYTYVQAADQAADRGAPLILLHGFGASIGHWRHNLPAFGEHYTVYALDLLGFGASEKAVAPFGIDLWVEQVYDFWKTFVRQPVVLVGNSIGSLVCLAIAAAHPDMVKGVVMLNLPDPSVLESPPWIKPAITLVKPISSPILGLAKWLFTTPLVFNGLFWMIRHPCLIRFWISRAYATRTAITDELMEIFSTPAFDLGASRTLRAMVNAKSKSKVNYSAKAVLPSLQVPMLLFWGMQDRMVPPKLARLFLKYNPNLQLIEIEGVGHCPHDECPERVNQEILHWLKGVEAVSEVG